MTQWSKFKSLGHNWGKIDVNKQQKVHAEKKVALVKKCQDIILPLERILKFLFFLFSAFFYRLFFCDVTGDEILSVNGHSTNGLSHSEAIAIFKSIRTGKVIVQIARRDGIQTRSVEFYSYTVWPDDLVKISPKVAQYFTEQKINFNFFA